MTSTIYPPLEDQGFTRLEQLKVGIQGVAASFHDQAARRFYLNRPIATISSSSFPLLCRGLRDGITDIALMAIENTIAGSLLPNYSLLENYLFQILGEVYLRIEMNLMALPGQKLEDIQFVTSHPMALLQCADFLMTCPWIKVIEGADTAESAKEISEGKKWGYAAIASRLAAETYHLEILNCGIESNNKNYTRFLVICRNENYQPSPLSNKASFRFEVPDEPGSLVKILAVLDDFSLNMTHLQSLVIPGRPYEYSFHIDLEWKDETSYQMAMAKIQTKALRLIHFGVYPKGETVP